MRKRTGIELGDLTADAIGEPLTPTLRGFLMARGFKPGPLGGFHVPMAAFEGRMELERRVLQIFTPREHHRGWTRRRH